MISLTYLGMANRFTRSRAVAVSASSDYFGVFTLKQPPVLQSQMADHQLDPISEVCAQL